MPAREVIEVNHPLFMSRLGLVSALLLAARGRSLCLRPLAFPLLRHRDRGQNTQEKNNGQISSPGSHTLDPFGLPKMRLALFVLPRRLWRKLRPNE